ncbi:MAG: GTPase Era [Herpetosiphonaceae bacterium]|nr:GTPase Era [Herpetosiphonaceae bacterium]
MLELTFDPDARTLYAYFTPIDEGEDSDQAEFPGMFLLDAAGQIVAFHVEIGKDLPVTALRDALTHPEVHLDHDDTVLRLTFSQETPDTHVDLPYQAIIDRDRTGRALGIEFIADMEFEIAQRLRWLQPSIVEVFGSDEEGTEGAAVFATEVTSDAGAREDEVEHDEVAAPPRISDEEVRVGLVALVGKPNVGKSTLLNAYFGAKLSIVSPKPQTTRIVVRGILNRPQAQIVFVDTPGLHKPQSQLGEYMVEAARRSIPDADVICFVVDATEPPTSQDRIIAESIKKAHKPTILVLNKVDIAHHVDLYLQAFQEMGPWEMEVAVSAKEAEGIEGLLEEIIQRLPMGPRLFPEDQQTDLSPREQVAELVREKVLLNTQQEVPHGVAVEVEEWEERGERLYIRATVNVERDGHKGIIIGDRGQMLKKIGAAARYEIERLLGRPVFLDLWVKVRKDWRSDPSALHWLGYDIKKLKS